MGHDSVDQNREFKISYGSILTVKNKRFVQELFRPSKIVAGNEAGRQVQDSMSPFESSAYSL